MSGFSFDEHLVAPHTAACVAFDGLCEHDERMSEQLAMAEEHGIDPQATAEIAMSRTWWRDLTAFIDLAAYNVETREEYDGGGYDGPRTPGCSCPSCDEYLVHISGKLIDLMRLNIVLADTSWGRGQEMRDAYAEFWPALASALGE